MHCKKLLSAAIACVLFMLSGCDRTTESSNYRLNMSPSLGFIKNAAVRIYAADGITLLSKGTTGVNGELAMFPGGIKGPIIISVQGTANSTYFDEYLQAEVSFPLGYKMRAMLPNAYGSYGISPLTEMAYRIAVSQNLFPLTLNEVNIVNERVRAAMAPELGSIVQSVTILDAEAMLNLALNPMSDTGANRYALRLAALAGLGAGQSRPALSVMEALSNDILDGVIDGLNGSSSVSAPYDPNTIISDSTTIINNLAAMYAGTDLINAVGGYQPITLTVDLANIDDGSNFSGCVEPELTELPPTLANLTTHMYFQSTDATAPFAMNEVVMFTFCANGQLRLSGNYYVVSQEFTKTVDPLDPTPVVYTWNQLTNGMVYELVALDDAIYELNVYGQNGALYYGRFLP